MELLHDDDAVDSIIDTIMEQYNNVNEYGVMEGQAISKHVLYRMYFCSSGKSGDTIDFYMSLVPSDFTDQAAYNEYKEAEAKEQEERNKRLEEEKQKAEEERQRQEAEKAKTHKEGMYKVGSDLPAGEYVMIASGNSAYFQVSTTSSGSMKDIAANGNFTTNSYVTVTEGQYLTVKNAKFLSVDDYDKVDIKQEGMFKIGKDLPAGEYKVTSTGTRSAYLEVTSNSSHSLYSIITNDNFTGERYITVSDGQYLRLNNARIIE